MHIYLFQSILPISHGDPGASNTGNASPFRMERVLFGRKGISKADYSSPLLTGIEPEDEDERQAAALLKAEDKINALAQLYPLPENHPVTEALLELKAEEFVASVFVFSLILELNRLDEKDAGLFDGIGRYSMLLSRINIATSSTATSLFKLYGAILEGLRIEVALHGMKEKLPYFFQLPSAIQQGVIQVLAEDARTIIDGVARPLFDMIREALKAEDKKPKADMPTSGGMFAEFEVKAPEIVFYNPHNRIMGTSLDVAEASIPTISANAYRHSIFRETLFNHLLSECDLGSIEDVVANGTLPAWVVMLFSNAGNVQGGAKTPDNSAAINFAVKKMFPSLDLLSGCLPTHIMGDGRLNVGSHTLCVQSNEFTEGLGYTSTMDAASLLQTITNTRHVPTGMDKSKESGQMLFSYIALKKGVKLLLTTNFAPFTPELTRGAAYFAMQEWLNKGGEIGGRSASGCGQLQLLDGRVQGSYTEDDPIALSVKYQEYIRKNREMLRDALVKGTLGWSKKLA
jgi:hypothetical protein